MIASGIVYSANYGSKERASGERKISLSLLAKAKENSIRPAGTLPGEMIIDPGDRIEIRADNIEDFAPSEIHLVRKAAASLVEVEATISAISSRNYWGIKATINAGGFIYVIADKGVIPAAVKVERGLSYKFVGLPGMDYWGKPALHLVESLRNPSGQLVESVVALDREMHDPIMLAARHNFPGFDESHERKLRAEIGEEWAQHIVQNPKLLERDAFRRWRPDTRNRIMRVAVDIANMHPLRRDLLTVGYMLTAGPKRREKAIAKIIEGEERPDAFFASDRDARHLVRPHEAGYKERAPLSLTQADAANGLGNYFNGGAVIPGSNRPGRALAAIW